jgi:hypothetical protein
MRAMWLLVLLGACSPDITSGSYVCGAQDSCPPDQACDGVTDTCVLTAVAMPFACDMNTEHAGDDTSATARPIPMLACVSPPYRESGCMPAGDAADWFKLTTPASCAAVEVDARLVYPVAYQGLSLELWDLTMNSVVGTDNECPDGINDPAHVERCINLKVTPGGYLGLVVKPSGQGTCDGACAYNRYDLSVQLATPR